MNDLDEFKSQTLVVHPFTGEVLEQLSEREASELAGTLDALRSRQTQLAAMEAQLEAELRKRIGQDRRLAVFGEWEVEAGSRRRVWDGAELEGVLNDLCDRGLLEVAQARGVITWEPKVAGREALRVMSCLDGEAKAQVEDCFSWKESAKLKLTRSVDFPTAKAMEQSDATVAALTAGGSDRDTPPDASQPERGPAADTARTRRAPLDPAELFQ